MYLYQKGHSPITSHITIFGKNECDCISISKSDYIYEYEIKISRADFKKDFTKIKHTNIINENYTKVRKGETFYFPANQEHWLEAGKWGATILWVSSPPNF